MLAELRHAGADHAGIVVVNRTQAARGVDLIDGELDDFHVQAALAF